MSNLRIEHQTFYRYTRPVALGRHRLVLRPREGHDLRVVSMQLEIRPAHRLVWARDVFGNSVAIVDFLEETTELEIRSDVLVQRETLFPSQDTHDPWRVPYPVIYDPLEMTVSAAYQASSHPDDVDEIHAWLNTALPERDAADAEGLVCELGLAVHHHIKYQRRHEKGTRTPAQTLDLKEGSCRDMATLMMDAVPHLGNCSPLRERLSRLSRFGGRPARPCMLGRNSICRPSVGVALTLRLASPHRSNTW